MQKLVSLISVLVLALTVGPAFAQLGGTTGGGPTPSSCAAGQAVIGYTAYGSQLTCGNIAGSGNVSGPGPTTLNFIPQWGNTLGTALAVGLPVAITVPSTGSLVETNASNRIDTTLMPSPTASTLGGIESFAAISHQWINAISTAGVPTAVRPVCADLNDSQTGCTTTVGTMATQNASAVAITGGTITGLGTPVAASDVVIKSYADGLANNTFYHSPVQAAAAGSVALPNSPTFASPACATTTLTANTNAAFALDGYSGLLNDRFLVANQATAAQNGIYQLTTVGSGAAPWVLTRAADFNTVAAGNIALGASVLVKMGTVNGGFNFWMSQSAAITCNTTALTWVQSAQTTIYTASNGITLSGVNFALTNIAANSVPANATGSPAPPTTAVAYSATAAANTIAETGAGGTLASGFLPVPSASTLGGIESISCATSNWINIISTSGVPGCAQPAFSDISGLATLAQFPNIATNTVIGRVAAGTGVPSALTTAQATTLCNVFTSTLSGCAAASGGGTLNFLRADGAWVPGTAAPTLQACTVQTASYTLKYSGSSICGSASDTNGIVTFNASATGVIATVPQSTSTVFPPGTGATIANKGSSAFLITACLGAGATWNTSSTALIVANALCPASGLGITIQPGQAVQVVTDASNNWYAVMTTGPVLPASATNDAGTVGTLGEVISAKCVQANQTATITIASPGVVTVTTSPSIGCPVNFTTTGALPTGITAGTQYFVISAGWTATSFEIATTPTGAAINTSGTQSGVQTMVDTFLMSTGVAKSWAAVPLTPGNWNCFGNIIITEGTTWTIVQGSFSQSINTVSATDSSAFELAVAGTTGVPLAMGYPMSQQILSANTELYAGINHTFAGTDSAQGNIICQRPR